MLETGVYVVGKSACMVACTLVHSLSRWPPSLLAGEGGVGHVPLNPPSPRFLVNFSSIMFYCLVVVNGFVMVIWIGQQVSGDMVAKLFGVTSQAQINMDTVSLCQR